MFSIRCVSDIFFFFARCAAELANTFTTLPKYDTPKAKGQRRAPKCNPFNDGLVHRLCAPTCSPDVFLNVKSPSEVSPISEL